MTHDYLKKAQVLYRRGDARAALDLLLKLIGAFPDDARGYLRLAELMRDIGRPESALSVLGEMPAAVRDHRFDSAMALALADTEQNDAAAAAADRLMTDTSTAAAGLLVKSRLAERFGDGVDAIRLLKRAVAVDPGCGEALTRLGDILRRVGETDEALDMLAKGLEAAPWRTDAATCYHEAVRALAAWQHAEPVFRRVFDMAPEIERTTCLYIDVLLHLGNLERALATVRTALAVMGPSDGLLDGALGIQRQLGPAAPPQETALMSLCMIVKDEQACLAGCLVSAAPVVDEMIVVDTGSTDRTRDVARVFGARVIDVPWADDFSRARNTGLEMATGRWILVLDADEIISTRDHDALRRIARETAPGSAAFSIVTRNYLHQMNALGWQPNEPRYSAEAAGSGWFPSEKVRLFPNLPSVRFTYPVHEVVEPSLQQAGIDIRRCPVPVHHYGKLDLGRSLKKGEAYFQIGLQKVDDMAGDPMALRELAIQAMNLERFDDAAILWQRLADDEPDRVDTLVNLGTAHWHCGRYTQARDCARQAVALAPQLKEARYNLANSLLHLGATEQAAEILTGTVDRHPDYMAGRFLLAAVLCCCGRTEPGRAALSLLHHTDLGPGLGIACDTLVQSLTAAGQSALARRLSEAAESAPCGNGGKPLPAVGKGERSFAGGVT